MPLCRDSVSNFLLIIFWLKCAAAAAGVICLFVHYYHRLKPECKVIGEVSQQSHLECKVIGETTKHFWF